MNVLRDGVVEVTSPLNLEELFDLRLSPEQGDLQTLDEDPTLIFPATPADKKIIEGMMGSVARGSNTEWLLSRLRANQYPYKLVYEVSMFTTGFMQLTYCELDQMHPVVRQLKITNLFTDTLC